MPPASVVARNAAAAANKKNVTSITSIPSRSGPPVNPDVRLKKLPFFILEEVLVKPTTLVCGEGGGRPQEQVVRFSLTAAQLRRVTQSKQGKEFRQQVQLRLSLLDISCEQEDNFPSKASTTNIKSHRDIA